MCAILQRCAPDGALIARLGGDEFGVLFDTAGEEAATMACDRLVVTCSTQHIVFGHSVQGGASAGLVVTEGGTGRDPIDVVRRADLALNHAKRTGRGVVRLFDESMDEGIRFRRRIEHGMGSAIARGELSLVYTPIVTGRFQRRCVLGKRHRLFRFDEAVSRPRRVRSQCQSRRDRSGNKCAFAESPNESFIVPRRRRDQMTQTARDQTRRQIAQGRRNGHTACS